MAGRADLPWELLQKIIEKLPIQDNLRVVHFLRPWWKTLKEQPAPLRLPWLLIHPLPNNEKPNIAAFFDLSRGEVLRIPVPLPLFSERICVGSMGGWMVTVSRKTLEAHLLNPVNGRQINLPRFRHISARELNEDLNVSSVKKMDDRFAELLVDNIDALLGRSKAVVSWDKREDNGEVTFTVVIMLHFKRCIIVAREGQPDWQVLQPPQRYGDVMTNANGKFFFLDTLHSWVDIRSLQHQDFQLNFEHLSLQMPQDQEIDLEFAYLAGWLLGEELGEIFILVKALPPSARLDKRIEVEVPHFKVFKYDDNVGHFKEVYDLGGKSIFVGASNAIVLSLPGLRGNNIYYYDGFNYPNDVCIYNMEEHSFQKIANGVRRPIFLIDGEWYMPKWLNAVWLDAVWLSPSFE